MRLDTDTMSFALRGVGQLGEVLRQHRTYEVAVSAITVAELRLGAQERGSRRLNRLLDTFLSAVIQFPFDSRAAERYGQVAAQLVAQGESIGMADAMIAAHALELDATLVTHNLKHFERVEDLRIVDWV